MENRISQLEKKAYLYPDEYTKADQEEYENLIDQALNKFQSHKP
jgi:hypothetical protein